MQLHSVHYRTLHSNNLRNIVVVLKCYSIQKTLKWNTSEISKNQCEWSIKLIFEWDFFFHHLHRQMMDFYLIILLLSLYRKFLATSLHVKFVKLIDFLCIYYECMFWNRHSVTSEHSGPQFFRDTNQSGLVVFSEKPISITDA